MLHLLPPENVAYHIARTISGLLLAITGAVPMSLFPEEGSEDEKELSSNVRRALKLLFILLILAVIFILLHVRGHSPTMKVLLNAPQMI